MSRDDTMTIGTLAEAAAVGRETIRFYERKGLIDDPPRSRAGYRLYSPGAVGRIRFIAGVRNSVSPWRRSRNSSI